MPALRNSLSVLPKLLLGAALLVGVASVGRAASESFSVTYPGPTNTDYALTNWTTSLAVTKFDPALGVLQSIDFELTGRVQGTVGFENTGPSAATITTDLQAIVRLQRPGTSVTLVTSFPDVQNTTAVSAYDGTSDNAGASGRTFGAGPAADTEDLFGSTQPTNLSLFTGPYGNPGTVPVPVTATAASSGTGSGNLTTTFTTLAGADITITYNYTPAPEPGTCALILGGLGALVGVQRFRRRR